MSGCSCPLSKPGANRVAASLVALALGLALPALAVDEDMPWLDNDHYKVSVDMRVRMELADIDGADASQAYTLRTRLGIGSKPIAGVSAFVEGEGTWAVAKTQYFDGTTSNSRGQTLIADPENIELNRVFALFEKPEWLGLWAKGGRQRIILDDARFIGNVGWRQNEQTYDATLGQTSLGVEGLTLQYGYIWDIRRIFGNTGPNTGTHDFDSDSHLIRVHYSGFEPLKMTAFAYLLDFEESSPGNSSNSYGLRVSGKRALDGPLRLSYSGSYAVQTDAGDNSVSYTAHYAAVEGGVAHSDLGAFTVGFEHLGSDNGKARFVTPLATAHKFNGWADAFLNNGGANGLDDFYVSFAPKMPWGLKGKVVYHHFWSDEKSDSLGDELDFVLNKPLNSHLTILTKAAWLEGTSKGPADRWRYWLQLNFKY